MGVDGDHVGAWDHDLAHEGLAELDDRAHHLAVLVLDGVGLADLVDHLAQVLVDGLTGLGVGGGGLGTAGAREEAALRGAQDVDPGEQTTQGQEGAGGIAPAVGARGEADDDSQQDDVGQQGQGQDLPPGAHEPGGGQGDEDGGEHVDGDAGDAEGAQDAGAVLGEAADPGGAAAALLDEVVGGGPGEAQQGGLSGREQGAQGQDDDRAGDERGGGDTGHAGLTCRARPGRSAGGGAGGRTSPSSPRARRGRSPGGGGCRGR